jgi:cysteine synthase A
VTKTRSQRKQFSRQDAVEENSWIQHAIERLIRDAEEASPTPVRKFPLPTGWGVDLYLKDESVHPTGSLKHRLARSLILQGLVSGLIRPNTLLVEASSGSTAISEAYFASLLGLAFVTVVPSSTSPSKLRAIARSGGEYITVQDAAAIGPTAARLCEEQDGYFLDQFANAAPATDWRTGNIGSELLEQLRTARHPIPDWIVISAGTGGTATTIGRYCRYAGLPSRVALADPSESSYSEYWRTRMPVKTAGSRIEGIGRPYPEQSFVPSAIAAAVVVPDALSIAAMRVLEDRMGIRAGASTGTNLAAALALVWRMREAGRAGSVVTLVCDSADRYDETYYDEGWLAAQGIDPAPAELALRNFLDVGDSAGFEALAQFVEREDSRYMPDQPDHMRAQGRAGT